jgi:tetratricopeptide (TPR) repeat protein
VVHYELKVPPDLKAPVELQVRLRYRKFDFEYMSIVHGCADKPFAEQLKLVPKLPVTDLCEDRVVLPVEGNALAVPEQKSPIEPAWQRWNDYGIGYFLTAEASMKKQGLKQAVEAFEQLSARYPDNPAALANAYVNLARAHEKNGELAKATKALEKVATDRLPAPWWTLSWFNGVVNAQNGHLEDAVKNFEEILDPDKQERERGFDFTKDYVVRNELALTIFRMSQREIDDLEARDRLLKRAVQEYERTLALDAENLEAHEGLRKCYERLGESEAPSDEPSAPALLPEEEMESLGRVLADSGRSREERLAAAGKLGVAVKALGQRPTEPGRPKLPVIAALIGQCRAVFHNADDPKVSIAAAYVLGHLHREAHAIYKPDDNAKDRTTALYRMKNPAARNAEQAVKVYPLHRPGAPGLRDTMTR